MLVLAAFTALLAALMWLAALLTRQPEAAPPAPGPDPYAAEVAEFRREMHDWTRDA